jgi:hypothetical protein
MTRKLSEVRKAYPFVELQDQHLFAYEAEFFKPDGVAPMKGTLTRAEPNILAANAAGWFVKKPDVENMALIEKKMLSDTIDERYMEFVTYDPNG